MGFKRVYISRICFLDVFLQAMAIYSNLSMPNKDQASELAQDQEEQTTSDKVDPELMKAIDSEIQKVKDTKFKDFREVQTEDLQNKGEVNSGMKGRRKTTKKTSAIDSE